MGKTVVPRKILVVDDDPVIGRSFDRVLSGKGYAVITAADGEEALRKLSAETYDVVFADIRMPGMSGIEVAKHLKESQPWLPVVIVTGYGTEENEARAKEVGVSGFLRKPLSPEMIMGATESTLSASVAEVVPDIVAPVAIDVAEAPTTAVENEVVVASRSKVKDVALFLAAPFIGLLYLVALPFIGLGLLFMAAVRAIEKKREVAGKPSLVKTVTRWTAAPLIGLAFVIALPFVGLGALIWFGATALFRNKKGE